MSPLQEPERSAAVPGKQAFHLPPLMQRHLSHPKSPGGGSSALPARSHSPGALIGSGIIENAPAHHTHRGEAAQSPSRPGAASQGGISQLVVCIARLIEVRLVIRVVDLETLIQISILALLHLSLCAADESTGLPQPDPCLAPLSGQTATEGWFCRVRKGQAGAGENCSEKPVLSKIL